jgi:hypothetical protein
VRLASSKVAAGGSIHDLLHYELEVEATAYEELQPEAGPLLITVMDLRQRALIRRRNNFLMYRHVEALV